MRRLAENELAITWKASASQLWGFAYFVQFLLMITKCLVGCKKSEDGNFDLSLFSNIWLTDQIVYGDKYGQSN